MGISKESQVVHKMYYLKLMLVGSHHQVQYLSPLLLINLVQTMFPGSEICEHLKDFQFLLSPQQFHFTLEYHHWQTIRNYHDCCQYQHLHHCIVDCSLLSTLVPDLVILAELLQNKHSPCKSIYSSI